MALLDQLPEAYLVQRMDGSLGVYRLEDWPLDSKDGEVVGRKFAGGHLMLYAGPDAGAPGDPGAYVDLRDLAGPDGVAHFRGRTYRWGLNGKRPPHVPSPSAP
jgi:hypothetical protein